MVHRSFISKDFSYKIPMSSHMLELRHYSWLKRARLWLLLVVRPFSYDFRLYPRAQVKYVLFP